MQSTSSYSLISFTPIGYSPRFQSFSHEPLGEKGFEFNPWNIMKKKEEITSSPFMLTADRVSEAVAPKPKKPRLNDSHDDSAKSSSFCLTCNEVLDFEDTGEDEDCSLQKKRTFTPSSNSAFSLETVSPSLRKKMKNPDAPTYFIPSENFFFEPRILEPKRPLNHLVRHANFLADISARFKL